MFRHAFLFVCALSVVGAWPIFFYETKNCNHYPVLTLEGPPEPGVCHDFGHIDIRSYCGETDDVVEKLLLYTKGYTCEDDAAHRSYANHTITNSTSSCYAFDHKNIPRRFVFIEEVLGPIKTKGALPAVNSAKFWNVLRIEAD